MDLHVHSLHHHQPAPRNFRSFSLPMRRVAGALVSFVWHHRDSLSEINVRLLNGALINWNWNGSSRASSHFANIIARVGHRPQESGLFLRGHETLFNNATLPHPGTNLDSACRIYIPNGSLWNWERPHGAAHVCVCSTQRSQGWWWWWWWGWDGAATSFSIRRIQSRNLSIHYSVIHWLIRTSGISTVATTTSNVLVAYLWVKFRWTDVAC